MQLHTTYSSTVCVYGHSTSYIIMYIQDLSLNLVALFGHEIHEFSVATISD